MNMTETPDPTTLSLADLRGLRQQLQLEDDAVSYARRVAQARLDMVKVEQVHRSDVDGGGAADDLRAVLSQHLTGGPARPPRPTEDLSDQPLAIELDELCARLGFGHLKELDDDALGVLFDELAAFEQRVSSDRRERFDRLDALSAELVRRYRVGEASIDTL
jgi:hypothetical protein